MGFLQSILVGMSLAVSSNQVVMGCLLGTLFVFQLGLRTSNLVVQIFERFLGFLICGISVFQRSVKIKDIGFKLLLHAESFSLSLRLRLNGSLHAFNGLAKVLPGRFKLFVLLGHTALNHLSHLSEFELGTENLVFLLLKGSFSFGKSSLQFHFLGLKTLANFVDLVDGASTFANLIHDVLDLIRKTSVFSANLIKLKNGFFISRLHTEELGRCNAGLLLAVIKIHANRINLSFPFSNNSIELLGFLVHRCVENLCLVELNGHFLKFTLKFSLGLLQLGELGIELTDGGLTLGKTGLDLEFGHFKFLSLGYAILLIPLPPHISLRVGLVELTCNIVLSSDLFIEMFLHSINFVFSIAEFSKKGLAFLRLIISNNFLIIKLSREGRLDFDKKVGIIFELLKLAKLVHQVLVGFFRRSLRSSNFISGSTNISNFMHDVVLVFFNLSLHFVECNLGRSSAAGFIKALT